MEAPARFERNIGDMLREFADKQIFLRKKNSKVSKNSPPNRPSQSEELEENHAHARHLSRTTHTVKKLPDINRPLTAPASSGHPN